MEAGEVDAGAHVFDLDGAQAREDGCVKVAVLQMAACEAERVARVKYCGDFGEDALVERHYGGIKGGYAVGDWRPDVAHVGGEGGRLRGPGPLTDQRPFCVRGETVLVDGITGVEGKV